MWTLIYMAADKSMIDKLCAILKKNAIIFRLRNMKSDASTDECGYELLVPAAEVEKAQELIFDTEIN